MREQFEKLPEIKRQIHKFIFDSDLNCYRNKDKSADIHLVTWVNGAYYAYQEQQKKIEAIKAIAEKWENTEYTYNSDSTDTKIEQMRICGREIIQELLK